MDLNDVITDFALSLDDPATRFWFLLALVAGVLIAILVGLPVILTKYIRRGRAYAKLMRRVAAARS